MVDILLPMVGYWEMLFGIKLRCLWGRAGQVRYEHVKGNSVFDVGLGNGIPWL